MVRVLVVLRGGYPWGFRMQGGGDRPLVVSKVTSTGKAGGAGVRAGCAVKAINGTPTAHLSLSNAHALTKHGATLTLEIEDNSEEPSGNSFSSSTSICSSTTSASTVVAANGHISSARRKPESGGSSEKVQDAFTDGRPSDYDKSEDSDSSVIFLETYGVDPQLLRNDDAEEYDEAEANQDTYPENNTSSLHLLTEFGLELSSESLYSVGSDEGTHTDHSSQTDTSTDTLVFDSPLPRVDLPDSNECPLGFDKNTQADIDRTGTEEHSVKRVTLTDKEEIRGTSIEYPSDLNDFDSFLQKQCDEDGSSGTDSFFSNFEEKLEQVELQFPNLQVEHLLPDEEDLKEEVTSSPLWVCKRTAEVTSSNIIEEKEKVATLETFLKPPRATKLETEMGQYYSSVSGAGTSKGGDVSGSLPSSPRSSEGWRISMASTATVGSSATAGSDDTVAKDMSELSSVNSHLSDLDETRTDGKIPPTPPTAPDPDATPKVTPVPQRKKQTSIKDAIDELESIEQAAQTLLLKRQFSSDDERLTPVPGRDSPILVLSSCSSIEVEKTSPRGKRKVTPSPPPPPGFADSPYTLPEGDVISDKLDKSLSSLESSLQVVDKHILDRQGAIAANGSSSPKLKRADQGSDAKAEVKPPLPPTAASASVLQQPKVDVKRRLWSKSKEVQLYISRESYNEERVLKELEKLRRSFQENDLNDFLDALDNTAIEDDIEEVFLTQLLEDLSEDIETLPVGLPGSSQQKIDDVVTITESSSEVSSDEATREMRDSSSTSSKLEKVREKISERIRKRKESKNSDSGSSDTSGTSKDTSRSDTPQVDRSTTLQPQITDFYDNSGQVQTSGGTKTEDTKKGFNIAQFLKKGSPKYLRKKYKERKNRKSDLITTSESESEDPEACKNEANGSVPKSQSNLKGSNRSLNGTQDTKKEVRFDLDPHGRSEEMDDCSAGRTTESNNLKHPADEAPTGPAAVPGPRLVTCEARRQETVVLKESEEGVQETLSKQQSPPQPFSPLPVVVEDINSRAESLLPKLPERVKPPRRKKMIPTPVEELSSHLSDTISATKSRKVTDARAEFLKSMTAEKDESPPPLPHYEEVLNTSKSPATAKEERTDLEAAGGLPVLAAQNESPQPLGETTVSVPNTGSASASLQLPSSTAPSGELILGSSFENCASVATVTLSQLTVSVPNVSKEEVLVAPIPVTPVTPISIALPEATKVVCPPRTLALPVIQECVHEDQMSIPTPSEPTTVSSSYGDTTPATPPSEEEKFNSLYDKVNPFKEMLAQEKLREGSDSAESTELTHQSKLRTEVVTEATTQRSLTPSNKLEDLSLPQAARKSPGTEKLEIVDIDALAALTAEMFKFAEEMEKEVPKKTTRPPFRGNTNVGRRDADTYTSRRKVETKEAGTEPETSHQTFLVNKAEKSNTIGIQTDNIRSVRTYEAASQTDTEYETDLETESEIEDNQHQKYDASKWTFGPTREQTLPLPSPLEPQLPHLHQQQQRLIQELQKQTVMHQGEEKAKPEVPPRHYHDKMPLKLVAELKNVLSDLEDSKPALSRAVEQPPRWDSQISWPHDDLATGTGEADLPGARAVGGTSDRQQTIVEAPGPPAAPARKPQTLLHPNSQNKQVEGNEAVVGRSAGTITKIRANVYPSFAPVIKVPTGKPPVPRPTLRRLSTDDKAAEEGYQSDPGGRRSNGRYRHPPPKTKLLHQIVEDRGYVTDTEVVFNKGSKNEKTLRSTWTPIGQLSPPELSSQGFAEQALQELGFDETSLLNEIEQILGVGTLTSNSGKPTDASPDQPEKSKSLVKPSPDPGESRKPRVPERDSSRGVWTPGRTERDESGGPSRIDLPDLPSFKDQPKVWTPARAGSASPSLGRKEYRKLGYESLASPQRRPSQENIITSPAIEDSFAWRDANVEKVARSPTSTSTSTLPKVQNPTVTLLQKRRDEPHSTSEGQIPGQRPEYLKPDDAPKYRPDDKLYVIKREYESEEEGGEGRRFAVLGPKKVTGVGPTTRDGVPTTLKSGVKSEHQGEWYKRMFDSLHKVKDDDHIIIKYKVPRARYGGYMSEPEGYDSDIGGGTLRYATVDRRRGPQYEADPMTSSLPRECLIDLDPYMRNANRYAHQPGRIEDYVPGYSTLAEKELKRSQSQEPPPVSVNHRFGSQMMSMTHALKESGYESDSTLVFKKREDARRLAPDPRKTSQVYRQIQRGGDIPITGLQKPNPPKPKEPLIGPLPFSYLSAAQRSPPARPESPYKYESGEVNIHYRTPVRIEQKESIPEEELARRQEEHMKKVYENERRKKYLAELEDIERRRHTDNFTPLQKSPIPLNRYDDESSLGTMRGVRTPDLKQVAKALYTFSAQNKREISFNKGDVIFIRRQIDKNWYEGEHRGSVGIFPCNYVEIVPYDSIRTLTRKPTEGQARARFNFQAQTSMEMSLSKGELVVLTRRVDENWYEGRIGNRKGIFPVSYVDTLMEPGADRPLTPSSSPMPRPALPAANLLYNGASSYSSPYSTLGRPGSQNDSRPYHQSLTVNTQQEPIPYRALYNYKPQNDDELELLENDLVMVMEKCDDGWFVGTSRRTGLFGTFPGNYVEKV